MRTQISMTHESCVTRASRAVVHYYYHHALCSTRAAKVTHPSVAAHQTNGQLVPAPTPAPAPEGGGGGPWSLAGAQAQGVQGARWCAGLAAAAPAAVDHRRDHDRFAWICGWLRLVSISVKWGHAPALHTVRSGHGEEERRGQRGVLSGPGRRPTSLCT